MKKLIWSAIFLTIIFYNASAIVLNSPDSSITIEINQDETMTVMHNNLKIFDINGLGLMLNGNKLIPDLKMVSRQSKIDEYYTMLSGKRRQCHNEANEYAFKMGKNGEMQVRVYNDGIALRYLLNHANGEITDDLTSYRWSNAQNRWLQKYIDNYEDFFPKYTSDMQLQGEWGYPALIQIDGDTFALVSEANIMRDNSASRLSNQQDALSYKATLADSKLPIKGDWVSPWRVAFVGDLSEIVESTLITDLSEPSKISDTAWIEPGIVSWVYWAHNHGSNDYQIVKQYIDLAKSLHLPYVLIDAEWDEMKNGGNIEDAVAYSLSQGVKPLIWYNSSTAWLKEYGAPGPHDRLNDPEKREAEFEKIAKWGVAGVKIDFFKGDLQATMEYCIDLLECAARHNLLVNFHGATIPRGWQRTYPNLMSIEAVYGAEWYNNRPTLTDRAAEHNVTLPFTRNVIGSMDYTPCAFSDSQHPHITSKGHELALTVVYESALQHIADRPESLLAQPREVQDFFGHLPSTWDETRLLGGYPGDWVAIARRKGDYWYIGILNGTDKEKTVNLDWSKITDAAVPCQYTIYSDHPSQNNQWHIVATYDTLPERCTLAPRGGQVIIVEQSNKDTDKRPAIVLLTAGQSNSDGRVKNELLPDYIKQNKYENCYWCYGSFGDLQTSGFEPFWPKTARKDIQDSWAYDAVTYYLLDKALNDDFYVIKWTLGGTAIDPSCQSTDGNYWCAQPEWLENNHSTLTGGKSLLLSFTEQIDQCIDNKLRDLPQGYEIKAFLWHQGESDYTAGTRYHDNLKMVVDYVRNYLVKKTGNKNYAHLPFIYGTVAHSNKCYDPEVESAMKSLAADDDNFYLVDMSDAALQNDELHFTESSAEYLGTEVYNVLVKLGIVEE